MKTLTNEHIYLALKPDYHNIMMMAVEGSAQPKWLSHVWDVKAPILQEAKVNSTKTLFNEI